MELIYLATLMVLFYLYLITQELMLGSTILIFSSGLLGSAVGRGAISVLSLSNERLLTHANGIIVGPSWSPWCVDWTHCLCSHLSYLEGHQLHSRFYVTAWCTNNHAWGLRRNALWYFYFSLIAAKLLPLYWSARMLPQLQLLDHFLPRTESFLEAKTSSWHALHFSG